MGPQARDDKPAYAPSRDGQTTTPVGPVGGPPRTPVWLVHVALFLVVGVACGGGTVVGKVGLNSKGVDPLVFALYRQAIATPVMAVWSRFTETQRSHPGFTREAVRQSVPRLLVAGLFLFVSNVCYTLAVKVANPVIGAAWQTTAPIFSLAAAMLAGWERATPLKTLGVLVSFGGAAFVVLYGASAEAEKARSWWLGHALFVANVNAWSLYSLATRPLVGRGGVGLPPVFVTGVTFAVVVVLLLLVVLVLPAIPGSGYDGVCTATWVCWTVSPTEAWVLAYFVVVFSVLLYSVINWANAHVPPLTNFVYTVVQPAAAALISAGIIATGYNNHASAEARLHEPGWNALGVIGVAVGLGLVLRGELASPGAAGGGSGARRRHSGAPNSEAERLLRVN